MKTYYCIKYVCDTVKTDRKLSDEWQLSWFCINKGVRCGHISTGCKLKTMDLGITLLMFRCRLQSGWEEEGARSAIYRTLSFIATL